MDQAALCLVDNMYMGGWCTCLTNTFVIFSKAYSKIKWFSQLSMKIQIIPNLVVVAIAHWRKEVSSEDLRLHIEDTLELQLVRGLVERLFDADGHRIPDYRCKNCNKVDLI